MSSIEKIKAMNRATITPAQAAEVLNCNPQYIRMQAREDPSKLGFPGVYRQADKDSPASIYSIHCRRRRRMVKHMKKAPTAAGTAISATMPKHENSDIVPGFDPVVKR